MTKRQINRQSYIDRYMFKKINIIVWNGRAEKQLDRHRYMNRQLDNYLSRDSDTEIERQTDTEIDRWKQQIDGKGREEDKS